LPVVDATELLTCNALRPQATRLGDSDSLDQWRQILATSPFDKRFLCPSSTSATSTKLREDSKTSTPQLTAFTNYECLSRPNFTVAQGPWHQSNTEADKMNERRSSNQPCILTSTLGIPVSPAVMPDELPTLAATGFYTDSRLQSKHATKWCRRRKRGFGHSQSPRQVFDLSLKEPSRGPTSSSPINPKDP
jgi:hypothetical protein